MMSLFCNLIDTVPFHLGSFSFLDRKEIVLHKKYYVDTEVFKDDNAHKGLWDT